MFGKLTWESISSVLSFIRDMPEKSMESVGEKKNQLNVLSGVIVASTNFATCVEYVSCFLAFVSMTLTFVLNLHLS